MTLYPFKGMCLDFYVLFNTLYWGPSSRQSDSNFWAKWLQWQSDSNFWAKWLQWFSRQLWHLGPFVVVRNNCTKVCQYNQRHEMRILSTTNDSSYAILRRKYFPLRSEPLSWLFHGSCVELSTTELPQWQIVISFEQNAG